MKAYRSILPSVEQERLRRVTISEASKQRQALTYRSQSIKRLPQAEWDLYLDIQRTLGIASLRMALVFGLRLIYAMWRDDRFRQTLLLMARELREENLDAQLRGEHKQHVYKPLLPIE